MNYRDNKMTVKELKEFLKDIDDDVEVKSSIIHYNKDAGIGLYNIYDISFNEKLNKIILES